MFTMLTSESCVKCGIIKNMFKTKNVEVAEVNAEGERGRQFVERFNIKSLPAFIKGDYCTFNPAEVLHG
jgi:glutaredoxin